ncbi:uncharacterized protein [Henckelia pumila]|uniref:uncharacterized protein n=1 Tax=Henckelia pumila TaxID=405737 RepID=UPI003C6E8606
MWLLHSGFMQTVRLNWNNPCAKNGLSRLVVKLKRLKNHLKWWNQEVFGNIHDKVRELDSLAAQAEEIFDSVASDENRAAMSLAKANLSLCLAMEEAFWKQKASAKWLVYCEKNTKLFHNMVARRRSRNNIFRIWDEGVALETPSLIRSLLCVFFQNLLIGEPTAPNKPYFDHIPVLIDEANNLSLMAPFTEQEVFDSVFSLHEDSSAGPDGFSAGFFRRCWDIFKVDLIEAVRDFWAGSSLPRSLIATTVILIPKTKAPQRWSDFWPISFCNVSNNIITKLITIRLSRILPKIISPSQSGFIAGRLISDNILLAQEMMGPVSKFYFVLLIAGSLSTLTAHYLDSSPRRGLGQGDPLSSLLVLDNLLTMPRVLSFHPKTVRRKKLVVTSLSLVLGKGHCLCDIWVLQPPGTVLHSFEMLCAKFLWGSKEGMLTTRWISWEKICYPISEGGLGIRRLKDTVTAFSIKLWFRFRTVGSLWSRFLLQKYYRNDPPAAVRSVQNISAVWRRMLKIRNRVELEIGWRIGDENIIFWFDSWFPDGLLSSLVTIHGQPNILVSWFLDDRNWNLERLLLVLPQEFAIRVLEVPVHCMGKDIAL